MSSLRIDLDPLRSAASTTKAGRKPPRRRRWGRRLLLVIVLTPVVVVVPLVLLLRGSLELHAAAGTGVGLSLAGGAAGALLILGLLIAGMAAALGLPGGLRRILARVAMLVAAGWVVSGLFFVAAENAKGDDVAAEYRDLHPFLRIASATLILFDRGAVLTDASRTVEDYEAMGLPANEASRHFEQPDGWVHALDLRTAGRPEWRNRGVALGFQAMGFETLRHVGTADHLHISLRP